MHTADRNSQLGYVCDIVSGMRPGECVDFDIRDLRDIPSFFHNDTHFNPADRVLENIIGSSYTHSYHMHGCGRTVTFVRHAENGKRYYTSPDRMSA